MRILEPDEVDALAEVIDGQYRAMVLAAAYAGLRFGELCALRMERLDFLRKALRVEESLSEVRGEFIFKAPKSKASRRTVSVPGFLIEELAQHLATYPDGSGLVFTSPSGGPIRRTNFRRRIWNPAVKASVGEPCTFHDLRHRPRRDSHCSGRAPRGHTGEARSRLDQDHTGYLRPPVRRTG